MLARVSGIPSKSSNHFLISVRKLSQCMFTEDIHPHARVYRFRVFYLDDLDGFAESQCWRGFPPSKCHPIAVQVNGRLGRISSFYKGKP